MRQQLYSKLLPSRGTYCVVGITSEGRISHRFADTIAAVETQILELEKTLTNIYVAPNSFIDNTSREAVNSLCSKSFFIDLDVGVAEHKYTNQADALIDLDKFITLHDLPPPVLINSGTGIQAYWIFDRDIEIQEWKPYAEAFKKLCLRSMKIDARVTADAARIMRCPDTSNYKTTPPSPTSILTPDLITEYDFNMFKAFLGTQKITPVSNNVFAMVVKGLDEETRAVAQDNFETIFSELAEKSLGLIPNEPGCAHIAYALRNPKIVSHDQWFDVLSVAVRCTDGAEAIHWVSEDWDGYDRQHTEFKATETLKANYAHMCETFEQNHPGLCNGCPHAGKLKPQSPLSIGRKLKVAQWNSTNEVSSPKIANPLPAELAPFVRTASGAIFINIPQGLDENAVPLPPQQLEIVPYNLYPVRRMYSEGRECIEWVYDTPNDGKRLMVLPLGEVYTNTGAIAILSTYGVQPDVGMVRHLVSYLIKWGQYMMGIKRAEDVRSQLGWTEDKEGFILGEVEIRSNGKVVPSAMSPMIRSIAKLVRPVGDYGIWKNCANMLNEPGLELQAFAVLCGFGSPLMPFTSTKGVVVSYYGEKGASKTGSMRAGLSVFCDPYTISVEVATANHARQRMMTLHNLMFARDEVGNMPDEELAEMIHNIANGKNKGRMKANEDAERALLLPWAGIGFITSNHSGRDKMHTFKKNPEGEMARMVDILLHTPKQIDNDGARGKQIFDPFNENYGWAGPEFIKEVFNIGFDAVRALLEKWAVLFRKDFGDKAALRFYENLISVTFAAGEIANRINIIKYDLDRIYFEVIRAMVLTRDDNKGSSEADYVAMVSEFFNENNHNFLIVDRGNLIQEPRQGLIGRIDVHNKRMYISKKLLDQSLSKDRIASITDFKIKLKRDKILMDVVKYRMAAGWKPGQFAAPVQTYEFTTDIVAIDNYVEKLNAPRG